MVFRLFSSRFVRYLLFKMDIVYYVFCNVFMSVFRLVEIYERGIWYMVYGCGECLFICYLFFDVDNFSLFFRDDDVCKDNGERFFLCCIIYFINNDNEDMFFR